MARIAYDFHIHSCLSPCGDEDMIPSNIAGMSAIKELQAIAVTDHNSCKNCPAVMELGKEYSITVIPGMELCTQEEVHVLCYFHTLEDAMNFDAYVSSKLPPIPNHEMIFGKQQIYDEKDQLIGVEPYLLINATEISFDQVSGLMKEFHGIYVPAHVDKTSNSLLSNLGFVPPDSDFTCVEIRDRGKEAELLEKHPYFQRCNILYDSDAHSLGNIQEPLNYIEVEANNIENILFALTQSRIS